ncbi:MAG: shikimate dehydrogenase, partial [Candidatus Binatia bacterium]
MSISGRTQVVGIIGDPVAHSLSPAMHNAAFQALGLDFTYVAFRVAPADLVRAVRGV